VKYADNFVLLGKEETVIQGTMDRLAEVGRYNGIEINVEKTKVMRISKKPLPCRS
jgi:hypothetical protein